MLDDIKKSISSAFYERTNNPFYGALIFSWAVWNWKIIYLTIFIDKDKLPINKIDFIVENYCEFNYLITYPLISTILLLTIVPFIVNGAYWLDLIFTAWKVNKKNNIEGKQLLTLEQSVKIRMEIRALEENFDKLIEKKNKEIEVLRAQLLAIEQASKISPNDTVVSKKKTNNTKKIEQSTIVYRGLDDLISIPEVYSVFGIIAKSIKNNYVFPDNTDERIKEYLLINDIVEPNEIEEGTFDLTSKGETLYKEYFNYNFRKK